MKEKKGILLFNPRAAESRARIPNSILSLAASVQHAFDWVIVDGNLEKNPLEKIFQYLESGRFSIFGCTVMPGIQIREAIPFSAAVKKAFPQVCIVWGGYFPAAHTETVLKSGFVDAVVIGPGGDSILRILHALHEGQELQGIPNVYFRTDHGIYRGPAEKPLATGLFPELPYETLDAMYPLPLYLKRGFLGEHIMTFHSSFGCPSDCSFCAVPGLFHRAWFACDADTIVNEIMKVRSRWGCDAVEFSDNNFFVSEDRVKKFAESIKDKGICWWGEGRVDTLMHYADETLEIMRHSGCKMIFMGAESGQEEILELAGKGGSQSGEQILDLASRLRRFGIIPEFSFVLGFPAPDERTMLRRTRKEIRFIRQLKKINPDAEIILYVYSPLPGDDNQLQGCVRNSGLRYPDRLEDWLLPPWRDFDLRRQPETPWSNKKALRLIRDFETVLNAFYPTISDHRLGRAARALLRGLSFLRYITGICQFPYELRILLKLLHYRQPEKEGF